MLQDDLFANRSCKEGMRAMNIRLLILVTAGLIWFLSGCHPAQEPNYKKNQYGYDIVLTSSGIQRAQELIDNGYSVESFLASQQKLVELLGKPSVIIDDGCCSNALWIGESLFVDLYFDCESSYGSLTIETNTHRSCY